MWEALRGARVVQQPKAWRKEGLSLTLILSLSSEGLESQACSGSWGLLLVGLCAGRCAHGTCDRGHEGSTGLREGLLEGGGSAEWAQEVTSLPRQ